MSEAKNKPDKTTSLIIVVIVLLAVAYFIYYSLPMLITMTGNILTLGLFLLVLGGILFVVLNPKIRNGLISKVTSIFRK